MSEYLSASARVQGKRPTAVEKLLGYGLVINPRQAHTTAQLVKYTGLSVPTVKRAQIALRAEGLMRRHVWMTQEGKRALWTFRVVDEHPLIEALTERLSVPVEIIGMASRLVVEHLGIGRSGLMEIIGMASRPDRHRFDSMGMAKFLMLCGRSTIAGLTCENGLDLSSELPAAQPKYVRECVGQEVRDAGTAPPTHTSTSSLAAPPSTTSGTSRASQRETPAETTPRRAWGARGETTAGTFDGLAFNPRIGRRHHEFETDSIIEAYRKGLVENGDDEPRHIERIAANVQAWLIETDEWSRVACAVAKLLDTEPWGSRTCALPGVPTVFEQDLDRVMRSTNSHPPLHTDVAQRVHALACRLHNEKSNWEEVA